MPVAQVLWSLCCIQQAAAQGVEVNTGLKHGFIYRPLKEWTEPTIAWAKR
jgi:hypothetical protein